MTVKVQFQQNFGQCVCMAGGKCRDCKPDNCKKNQLSSPVVFCADKIFSSYEGDTPRHCDEIVLYDVANQETGVYCIEHKGGNPDNFNPEYIRDQLQGGADIVCSCAHPGEKIKFAPVLVSKRREIMLSPPGIVPTVNFQGTEYPIGDVIIGEELKPL